MADNAVMIVADIFPPIAAVGVFRTVALCRHLVEQGRSVTVLTARPWAGESLDSNVQALVPPEVCVVATARPDLAMIAAGIMKRSRKSKNSSSYKPSTKTGQSKSSPSRKQQWVDWLSWWLHVPDSRIGWLVPAILAGIREAKKLHPAVIYCTAPGWTSHLVGYALSTLLRVPLVVDFQDPWCGSFWRKIPYASHRYCDEVMERKVVKRAAQITCAWDGIRKHLVARYPKRAQDIHTILNGFFPNETDGVMPTRLDEHRCVLLHAGSFYGPRRPEPILVALKQLSENIPDLAQQLLVVFVGPPNYSGRPIQDIVKEHGVEELVRMIPSVGRQEALALTRGADAALLFGQSGYESLASVPAKTYDYVSYGLPVFAIGCGDEVCRITEEGGCRLWRASAENTDDIAQALQTILQAHQNKLLTPTPSKKRLAFAWPASAAKLASVLDNCLNQHKS